MAEQRVTKEIVQTAQSQPANARCTNLFFRIAKSFATKGLVSAICLQIARPFATKELVSAIYLQVAVKEASPSSGGGWRSPINMRSVIGSPIVRGAAA